MDYHALILVVAIPSLLGALIFWYRKNPRLQRTLCVATILAHATLLVIFEVISYSSAKNEANTWEGYTLIELGPFGLVFLALFLLQPALQSRSIVIAALAATFILPVYWLGILIFVTIAVNAGFAAF